MQWITFYFNSRWHKYKVDRLPDKDMRECWKVIAGNGELMLSNNRPMLIKKRLKHWKPEWKADPQIHNRHLEELICQAIERLRQ